MGLSKEKILDPLEKKSCSICAWRENCQKRFASTSDIALTCPEYTRDVTLKEPPSKYHSPPEKNEKQ
jgi:hypothetical protein